jgi:hypothetical protein
MPDKTALGLFGEELNAKPRPRIIYHYTDAKGLKGILESGALWLTDIRNLNNPSELKHGFATQSKSSIKWLPRDLPLK